MKKGELKQVFAHLETQKRKIFGYIWLIGLGLLTEDIWNHKPKVVGFDFY